MVGLNGFDVWCIIFVLAVLNGIIMKNTLQKFA